MPNIIVRLRQGFGGLVPPICDEAADVIEKLLEELEVIKLRRIAEVDMDDYKKERELRDLIGLAAFKAEKEKKSLGNLCLACLSVDEVIFTELKKVRDVTAVGYRRVETWICPACEWEEEKKVY